jgi:heme/copper-type cytochrome/quinol oxidase subunit 3
MILGRDKIYSYYNTAESRERMENYITQDVSFTTERRYFHYYNDIPYTRWPFYISIFLFLFLFFSVLYINKYEYSGYLTLISFFSLVYNVFGWFNDMLIESMVFGKYNRKVRKTLAAGFILFIVSETLLFSGFFWTYFDRFFHPSAFLGNRSVPYGFEMAIWYKKPLVATFVLIASGYIGNCAHYYMKMKDWETAVCYSIACIIFGYAFLAMQLEEYMHLYFDISDSVFGSIFYLLTGFHGIHVLVGMIMLNFQHDRLYNYHFSQERNLGYGLALLYWHFVDIIWILLFISIYVLNFNVQQAEYDYFSYFRIRFKFSMSFE